MAKLKFGELELRIINIIRGLGRVTVRDVYEGLGSPGGYTTIMTVMSRMADKGELMREKEGKQYVYWIAAQNESTSKSILKRIKDKIFGGKPAAMLSCLLDADSGISDKDLEEIEKLIQKRRSEKKRG